MKKIICLLMALMLLLSGCAGNPREAGDFLSGSRMTVEAERTPSSESQTQPSGSETLPSGTEEASSAEILSLGKTDAETSAEESREAQGSFDESDLCFTYRDTVLSIDADFGPLQETIDETPHIERGQACIGGGFDINYYYHNDELTVYTLGDTGAQIIYDIYLTGDGMRTDKGAVIGQTTRDQLEELYGKPSSVIAATDRYTLDGRVVVSFTFAGGVLASMDIQNTEAGR